MPAGVYFIHIIHTESYQWHDDVIMAWKHLVAVIIIAKHVYEKF